MSTAINRGERKERLKKINSSQIAIINLHSR